MSLNSHPDSRPFPLSPIALKILGDAVLAATLLRAGDLPADAQGQAVVLALLLGLGTSMAAGVMLVRAGQGLLWEITTVACLVAMTVLLALHGVLFFALMFGGIALWRWQQLKSKRAGG